MAQFFFILVKTGIFYEFSKWRKIEILKPISEPQKLPKRNGSSVVHDVKPGLRSLGVLSFVCCGLPRSRGEERCVTRQRTAARETTCVVTTINACEGRNNA